MILDVDDPALLIFDVLTHVVVIDRLDANRPVTFLPLQGQDHPLNGRLFRDES